MSKATAIFDGDDSALQAVILRLDRKLSALQAKFASVAGFTAKLFAAPAAVAAGGALGVKSVLDVAGELNDGMANTGIAVDQLLILQQEFKNAGKAAEDVAPAIGKMQKNLADGTAAETIADLGLSMEDLQALSPEKQFHAIGEAINKIDSPAKRTATAMAIFGKSGATMLSMFASKGFGDAGAQVGEQAAILARDAALFDDVGDKLSLVGLKVQGFFVGVADRVVPVIAPLLDQFANLDLAQMGQDVGDFIATFLEIASAGWGEVAAIAGTALLVSAGRVLNFFDSGFKTLVDNLADLLLGVAEVFGAAIARAGARVLDAVSNVPGLGAAAGGAQSLRSGAAKMEADSRARAERLGTWRQADSPLTDALAEKLDGMLTPHLAAVEKARTDALARVPTSKGAGAPDEFGGRGDTSAVTSLARVAGAFGGGGADPMLDVGRETNQVLREILNAVSAGDKYAPRRDLQAAYL